MNKGVKMLKRNRPLKRGTGLKRTTPRPLTRGTGLQNKTTPRPLTRGLGLKNDK
tara:strand:+ start:5587 stop:5748 length:162 start_codon:yes stop_codon:yes gene_type:complete